MLPALRAVTWFRAQFYQGKTLTKYAKHGYPGIQSNKGNVAAICIKRASEVDEADATGRKAFRPVAQEAV